MLKTNDKTGLQLITATSPSMTHIYGFKKEGIDATA